MADPDLNESAWHRAKSDAAATYRSPTFGVALAIMELLAIPAAVLATAGHEDTAHQIVVPILSGALALAFAFIVVLVVQVSAAPMRQRNELRSAWEAPPSQPDDLGVRLWNAYRMGSDLAQRLDGIPAPARDWKEAEAWASQVVDLLAGNVPEELAREFFSAGEYDDDLVRQVSDRTEELRKIIERLG